MVPSVNVGTFKCSYLTNMPAVCCRSFKKFVLMLTMTEARILLVSYLPILDKYVFLCVAPKWFELDDKECWHFKNLPNHLLVHIFMLQYY